MPGQRMFFLMVISCLSVLLTPEQKKPTTVPSQQRQPVDQTRPGFPGQIQLAPAEKNKAHVRRVFDDLFNARRYEFIEEIYAKECPVHFGNRTVRLEQAISEGKGWHSAAPDFKMTVERIEAERDFVMVDWVARGTNTGKGNGASATGKKVMIRGNSKFRVANGKIVEVWNNFDRDEIFRQLGVPPKLGRLYYDAQDFLYTMNDIFFGSKAEDSPQLN